MNAARGASIEKKGREKGLVSVIMPVYNLRDYIREAVESVLKQTEPRFELLLIDDGSTDGSGAIADEYAGQDPRVKVFHTENRGVSAARNRGMDEARGEWLFFLDGDDRLEEDALETLLAHSEGMDLVAGDYESPYTDASHLQPSAVFDMRHMTGEEWEAFYRSRIVWTSWNMLYRAERVKCRFREDMTYLEDTAFLALLVPSLRRVCRVARVTYHYRERRDSLSRTVDYRYFENVRVTFRRMARLFGSCPRAMAGESRIYVNHLYLHLGLMKNQLHGNRTLWQAMAEEWLTDCEEELSLIRTDRFSADMLTFWQAVQARDRDSLWQMTPGGDRCFAYDPAASSSGPDGVPEGFSKYIVSRTDPDR